MLSCTTRNSSTECASQPPCVMPPSLFRPVVAAYENVNPLYPSSTRVTCSLPDWTHVDTCSYPRNKVTHQVVLYVHVSSNFKRYTRHTIAVLNTNGTCYVSPGHWCSIGSSGNMSDRRVLMEVEMQDTVFYDVAGEPGAMVFVSCAMAGAPKDTNKIMLTAGKQSKLSITRW